MDGSRTIAVSLGILAVAVAWSASCDNGRSSAAVVDAGTADHGVNRKDAGKSSDAGGGAGDDQAATGSDDGPDTGLDDAGASPDDGGGAVCDPAAAPPAVTESGGSFLCKPACPGRLPGVLYNHGGVGSAIGGDLKGTCEALAKGGFVGYSKKRRETDRLEGHLDDVREGFAALKATPEVDPARIGVIGFSRGGLLTLQLALEQGNALRAVVLLAPAPGNGTLSNTLDTIGPGTAIAPVLVLVSENDTVQANHVQLARDVEAALGKAGKEVTLKIYPPYGSDGHELFFSVGTYWPDVIAFIGPRLK